MKESILLQVQSRLIGVADMIYQPLQIGPLHCTLLYIQSIVDTQIMREAIVKPLLEEAARNEVGPDFVTQVVSGTFFSLENQHRDSADTLVDDIVTGNAALHVEGMSGMIIFSIQNYQKRSVPESTNEVVIVGPQEAFIEDINVNMSLLRHKIKHSDFKMIKFTIGKYTKTEVFVIYIQGLCKPDILENVLTSLGEIDMDSSLGVSYLSEFLEITRSSFSTVSIYRKTGYCCRSTGRRTNWGHAGWNPLLAAHSSYILLFDAIVRGLLPAVPFRFIYSNDPFAVRRHCFPVAFHIRSGHYISSRDYSHQSAHHHCIRKREHSFSGIN